MVLGKMTMLCELFWVQPLQEGTHDVSSQEGFLAFVLFLTQCRPISFAVLLPSLSQQ